MGTSTSIQKICMKAYKGQNGYLKPIHEAVKAAGFRCRYGRTITPEVIRNIIYGRNNYYDEIKIFILELCRVHIESKIAIEKEIKNVKRISDELV